MLHWASFAAVVFIVVAILALLLPRRQLLLLGIAAVAGIVATMLFDWRVPQRPSEVTYQVIYLISAQCVVSAILGYLWPWKAWQWGLIPFLADAIWQVVGPYSTVGWGNRLYDTDTGKSYSGNLLELDARTVRVEGCALGICGGEKMTRVTR